MRSVVLKRVYERPAASDGTRILVDRLWPRGLSKAKAVLDGWNKRLIADNPIMGIPIVEKCRSVCWKT
jgi:uncharacterized protein YeaO (DUF488 family)